MNDTTIEREIDELLTRGIENIYPSVDFLKAKLLAGKPVSLYLGIDPTGPTLHIGHAIILKKLQAFQKLGHKVILLIGDFTGMIGDPTDKTATRKALTRKEVLANAKLYKKQASVFLSFSGRNKAELKYNSKWLAKMKFEDVLNLASRMTVDQMLKRDMFDRRIAEGKPIYIHEFMYPLMQGYDSVAMDVDGEIGGNDQTFNMLAGRTLMKEFKNKEKFVITMKLLADQTGKKMGKSEGNMIAFTDTPQDMFGKVMSWTDGMIVPGFELCTNVPGEDLTTIAERLQNGAINPKELKMELARELVTIYYGEDEAAKAEEAFTKTFSEGGIPEDLETITVPEGTLLVDILIKENIVPSKSEWRRLIESNAISNAETNEKVTDPFARAQLGVWKVGKRRFIKISLEK